MNLPSSLMRNCSRLLYTNLCRYDKIHFSPVFHPHTWLVSVCTLNIKPYMHLSKWRFFLFGVFFVGCSVRRLEGIIGGVAFISRPLMWWAVLKAPSNTIWWFQCSIKYFPVMCENIFFAQNLTFLYCSALCRQMLHNLFPKVATICQRFYVTRDDDKNPLVHCIS